MSRIIEVISHSEEETEGLAHKLAAAFRQEDVVVLKGELGSGKTVFVRGLAYALGLDEQQVNSPSYTLVNEYSGNNPLYHFDLYRLQDENELHEIGWNDYLSRSGLVVVEWGEKAGSFLPQKYYLIEFEIVDEHQRKITIRTVGS